jgi:hypothetical protein
LESLRTALHAAANLIERLAPENAAGFLAWWKENQYLTFYPVDVVRRYHRENSQEIVSDYVHKAVINSGVTVGIGADRLWIPFWKEREIKIIWKPGDPPPDLSQQLNLERLVIAAIPDNRYSAAVLSWCRRMLSFAARDDVTLLQIPPASVKLKFGRSDAILRMAYFPEIKEMVTCEL